MPEMARYCGQRLKVHRLAEKTCVEGLGLRRISRAVLLETARCDGSRHDGCQRNCLMFWKEAWLKPADEGELHEGVGEPEALARLESLPTRRGERYLCQSTALADATGPLASWDVLHLARDVRRGELTLAALAGMILRGLASRARRALGLAPRPGLGEGRRCKGDLGLKVGEQVRVRPADQIRATLGPDGKNLGLAFEPEMFRYAGGTYEIEFPVERIILEETGKMARLTNTVALKGLSCLGSCAKNCPRANTLYWREAWLDRVAQD
jgi:hypothetical protein